MWTSYTTPSDHSFETFSPSSSSSFPDAGHSQQHFPSGERGRSEHSSPPLTPFQQTQREQDRLFYTTFPAARQSQSHDWSSSSPPSVTTAWKNDTAAYYTDVYNGTSPEHMGSHDVGNSSSAFENTYRYSSPDTLLSHLSLNFSYEPNSAQPIQLVSPSTSQALSEPYHEHYSPHQYSLHSAQLVHSPIAMMSPASMPSPTDIYDSPTSYAYSTPEQPPMDFLPAPEDFEIPPTQRRIAYPPPAPDVVRSHAPYSYTVVSRPPGTAYPGAFQSDSMIRTRPCSASGDEHWEARVPVQEELIVKEHEAVLPSKPSKDKDKDKKPLLACFFCRGRKIACGAPDPNSTDKTCNQCRRRSLKCEYPSESRRGMRRKKADIAAAPVDTIGTYVQH